MVDQVINVLISGVGGQGVILASELLAEVAMRGGYDVKKSEVHGMAQRGGVVVSFVRFGQRVYSPLVPYGSVDILLAFEALEGLRWIDHLKPQGLAIISTQKIIPPIAYSKGHHYPDDPISEARAIRPNVISLEAVDIARQAGNVKMVNTVLLGAMANYLPFPLTLWEEVLLSRVPKGTQEANQKAFSLGMKVASELFKSSGLILCSPSESFAR